MTAGTITNQQANHRSREEFARARRHSRWVFFLKGLLPATAVFIAVYFAASAMISYIPSALLNIEGMGLESGNLVMHKPNLDGFDRNGQPYSVNAERAIQDLSNTGVIKLENITADLPVDESSQARVKADRGVYNSEAEKMRLTDNITVTGARGMDISLEEADIDIKSGNLVSDKPVQVISGDTEISSDSLLVKDSGERIVFKKRVRMTIKNPSASKAPSDNGSEMKSKSDTTTSN